MGRNKMITLRGRVTVRTDDGFSPVRVRQIVSCPIPSEDTRQEARGASESDGHGGERRGLSGRRVRRDAGTF